MQIYSTAMNGPVFHLWLALKQVVWRSPMWQRVHNDALGCTPGCREIEHRTIWRIAAW